MPQRITPSKILTVTKDGECHLTITLDLNINLNADGVGNLVVRPQSDPAKEVIEEDVEEDKFDWAIPDFSPNKFDSGAVNFGKDV